jgi:hypothetical protein
MERGLNFSERMGKILQQGGARLYMSTFENYLSTINALNDRMWGMAKPLEKELRSLEAEYKVASNRPITDVIARGASAILLNRIQVAAAKLNKIYDEWQRNLSLITPPPPTEDPKAFPPPKTPGKASSKIPWPDGVPMDVRRQLGRVIDQGGVPVGKRVSVSVATAPYGGGPGVVVKFTDW